MTACHKDNTDEAQNFVVEEKTTEISYENTPMENAPMYEASNAVMPGKSGEETYLYRNNWINNQDGTVSYNGEKYKRNAHIEAILCAGIDTKNNMHESSEDEEPGNADGIFLIAHDTFDNSVRVIMIPRDSMVDCVIDAPDGSKYTTFDHLNVSFGQGDGKKTSAESLKNTTSGLLCNLDINHYLVGDLTLLSEVNDMVGGVEVTIPNDELKKINPEWTKDSKVVLRGDEAEKFIRYRDTNNDGSPVVRMSQHKQYLSGFYNALKDNSRIDSSLVSKLADKVDASIVSDMSKGEYEKLVVDGIQADFNPDDIYTLPGTLTVGELDGEMYDEVYLDYTQVIPMLLDCFYRKVE
ncbi:MAG: LCP family protein [Lachnospiraceae bacterium]|nr:LCP family protein [Lachnospiraceae bacterium]